MSTDTALFRIDRVFRQSSHFAHTESSRRLSSDAKPGDMQLGVRLHHEERKDGLQRRLRVEAASVPQDDDLYEFSVEVVAEVSEYDAAEIPVNAFVNTLTPMVFPFVREAIAAMTMYGRFGPVWVAPFRIPEFDKPIESPPRAEDDTNTLNPDAATSSAGRD